MKGRVALEDSTEPHTKLVSRVPTPEERDEGCSLHAMIGS